MVLWCSRLMQSELSIFILEVLIKCTVMLTSFSGCGILMFLESLVYSIFNIEYVFGEGQFCGKSHEKASRREEQKAIEKCDPSSTYCHWLGCSVITWSMETAV